jgi:hypothetical protein
MSNKASPKGTTRIGFQNVHGISRGLNPAEEFIIVMNDYHLDIYGGAEVNCDWNDELKCQVNAHAQKKFGNSLLSTASTKFKSKHGYLPGGVMQLARGEIISRQAQQGSDPIGRYTWQRFSSKKDQKLCIITAYRVSQHKNFVGTGKDDTTDPMKLFLAHPMVFVGSIWKIKSGWFVFVMPLGLSVSTEIVLTAGVHH